MSSATTRYKQKTKSSEDERAKYGIDADIMMTIAERKMKGSITVKVDRIFAEWTQAEVQNQIEEPLVDVLQLGNSAASNGTETSSIRLHQTIVIGSFSGGAGDNVVGIPFWKEIEKKLFFHSQVNLTWRCSVASPLHQCKVFLSSA